MKARRAFTPSVEIVEHRRLLSAAHSRAVAAAAAAAANAQEVAVNTPPVILNATEVIQAKKVIAFQITFTKDVNPAPLSDLSHYALFDQGSHNPYGRSAVPLASATYNAPSRTLTLTPFSPAPVAAYVLTSPNPSDRSTAFIADAQGRPLLTSTRSFTVFFQPIGISLHNFVLTDSPQINQMTGANFIVPALASIRNDLSQTNAESRQVFYDGVARLSLVGAAWLYIKAALV
jgi:hypothetical protein